ncbi:hypothetical protein [Planctomycetes bacterium SV_7m_r]
MNRPLLVSIALLNRPVMRCCQSVRRLRASRFVSRSMLPALLLCNGLLAIHSDQIQAHTPDKQNQPVHQRYDVISPVGNRLPAGHRRKYNRPSYIGGKIAYWIAPSSQEAMSWHRAVHANAYKDPKKHQYIYQQYFYPKPWQLLPVGPRPITRESAERQKQRRLDAENIAPGPSIMEPPAIPQLPVENSPQQPADPEPPAETTETLGSMLIESDTVFGQVETPATDQVTPTDRSLQHPLPGKSSATAAVQQMAQAQVINIKSNTGLGDAALIRANLPPQSTEPQSDASQLPVSAAMVDLITPSWLRKERQVHVAASDRQGSANRNQGIGQHSAAEQGSTQPVRVVRTGALAAGINGQKQTGTIRAAHQAELPNAERRSPEIAIPFGQLPTPSSNQPASFNFILRDDGFVPADELETLSK